MNRSELRRFQAVLTARVSELERLIRYREGITIEKSSDELEEIQQASDRAVAVCNLDRDFKQLRDAHAAIRRIQEGSFGTCEQCDEDIHPKRLVAVPWASFCIRCQEAADRNPEEMQTPTRDTLVRAA
jgi:DnaK suppressor protein